MKILAGETLDLLVSEYKGLVKHDEEGLLKAYRFGHLVKALNQTGFAWKMMAEVLGVKSTQTVAKYAKLTEVYTTEEALKRASKKLGTVDVQLLAYRTRGGHWHTELHCKNCNGTEFSKVRVAGPRPVKTAVPA